MLNFKALKNKLNTRLILMIASFFVPGLILFIYFACYHFNFLTVDLGQQYIDFLSYLRQNLLTHPLRLIFSWQNSLGNSMLATNAYYLLSPFNLILFFFPLKYLTSAVLLIIILKIATSALTAYYYFQEKADQPIVSFSLANAYALSGFMIANYFNLMWLDSAIILPLLILNIDKLIAKKPNHVILLGALCWIVNFYTGYMVLLFSLIYFVSQSLLVQDQKNLKLWLTYLGKLVLSTLGAMFILLPVFSELLQGKAGSIPFNWSLQFNPSELLAKLTPGSYNFQEMSDGLPNIYLTSILLFGAIAYFIMQTSLKEKLVNGLVWIFLTSSLFFTPLVLLWHLGQFPIWYPARFSFIWVFFTLCLAKQFLSKNKPLSWKRKIILGAIAIAIVSYWLFNRNNFSFFNETAILLACLFIILTLLFYFFVFASHHIWPIYLSVVVILSLITNTYLSLNNLSFQNNHTYTNFTQQLQASLPKNTFHRSEKTFERSDNDDFSADYYGVSVFNSVSDSKTRNTLAKLGLIHNSNSIQYNGASPVLDSFLGIKYFLTINQVPSVVSGINKITFTNLTHRLDVNNYSLIKTFKQVTLLKNKNALNLAFLAPNGQNQLSFIQGEPAFNQNLLSKNLLSNDFTPLTQIDLPKPSLQNVTYSRIKNQYLKQNTNKPATVTYSFKVKGDYYLQLSSNIDDDNCEIWINKQLINLNIRDSQAYLLNLSASNKMTQVKLSFKLKNNNLDLAFIKLFKFQTSQFNQQLTHLRQTQPPIKQINALSFKTGAFSLKNRQRLITFIPNSQNWLVFDFNHKIKTTNYLTSFLAVNLKAGKHQLTFIYVPWLFLTGLVISFITFIGVCVFNARRKR